MLDDEFVIVRGVIGRNQHAVLVGQIVRCQRLTGHFGRVVMRIRGIFGTYGSL